VRSLRAREFTAIALAVVVSVAVTLTVAVVLVRRSAQQEALRALARQAALIAAQQRAASPTPGSSALGLYFATEQERLTIVSLPQAALLLPPDGAAALEADRPAQGSVNVGGRGYLYAAARERRNAIVLLRPANLAAADLHPFTIAFGVAAIVGAAIAALAAFLLGRAVARPIERVARASLARARGEQPGMLPLEGSTEVAALAAAFNQMSTDLDRATDAERSFLLSVSHELKTPLAAIRGHGEALLDGVMTVPQAAGVIVQESKRLDRLVRDLLDLARLNQRSFSTRTSSVDLVEVAAEALQRHAAEAERVGVRLRVESDGVAPARADFDRTLQVLSNLIENALRSTPDGGEVTISAAPGLLRVSDTGPGLGQEELPRAFERFFLHRRYATHGGVGTGLGLAIVKELVEAMGGTVEVESARGRGSSFSVRLPAAEEAAARALETPTSA
jgi:two-component system sensor histidine kinase BaeS